MTSKRVSYTPIGLALALGFATLQAPAQVQGEAPAVLKEPKALTGMNLDFTRGVKLAEVLQDLGRQSGVSIILHASVAARDTSTSADLRGMNFQMALDTLMLQNDLFYKVMDPTTIMVFKKTPQNIQEFETRVLKTFYLVNADVESTRQHINAIMPQVRVFLDKRISALTILATSSELARAQQLVTGLDRSRGEVRLQMEVVEVGHKASVAAGLLPAIETPSTPVAPDRALARVMREPDSKVLASPEVRVVAGEAAEVRFGQKAATAAKTEDTPQAGIVDGLGVRIKVRPRLHPNHEITLDVDFELTDPPKAGEPGPKERVIKTTVHLKDGETVVFGGLPEEETHDGAKAATPGKDRKERLLVLKPMVVRWGDQ